MASVEGGQHKRPATPIPRRLQLFRLGSVHLFFFACAFCMLLCPYTLLALSPSLAFLFRQLYPLSLSPLLSSLPPTLLRFLSVRLRGSFTLFHQYFFCLFVSLASSLRFYPEFLALTHNFCSRDARQTCPTPGTSISHARQRREVY